MATIEKGFKTILQRKRNGLFGKTRSHGGLVRGLRPCEKGSLLF
jgi:hypothetical protein